MGDGQRRANRVEDLAGRLLPFVFVLVTGFRASLFLLLPQDTGVDARLYADASRIWLDGGDPWLTRTTVDGLYFASTPPTLLLFAPFAHIDPWLTTVIWMTGLSLLAALALREMHLPAWWLAFPPLSDAIIQGNPDALVFAMLILGGGRLAWLAVFGKMYAVIPALSYGRRAMAPIAVALALTLPILPWGQYLADLPQIVANLDVQATHSSTWGTPFVFIAAPALLLLGRRSLWLAVPAIWPSAQPHYGASSIPGLSPVIALFWAFPHPASLTVGLVLEVVLGKRDHAAEASGRPRRAHGRRHEVHGAEASAASGYRA
jgi:hypothetical protein